MNQWKVVKEAWTHPAENSSAEPPVDFQSLSANWDPYWLWAARSNWRGFARQTRQGGKETDPSVRVLLRADSPARLKQIAQEAESKDGRAVKPVVQIDEAYVDAQVSFATGCLKRSQLAKLATIDGVEFELGAPLKDQGWGLVGSSKSLFGPDSESRDPIAEDRLKDVQEEQGFELGSVGTIAVFDYGCPFLRDEYAHGPREITRIQALWHQEELKPKHPWRPVEALSYGRRMDGAMLEGVRRKVFGSDDGLDDIQAYRCLNYLVDYDDPRRRVFSATHGAHVLDVVGGFADPLLLGKRTEPDHAAKANLIFVHMPEATAGDSSGASLGVYLLDALRFTLDTAIEKRPLVVNVSYGSTAGPHDGSSMIEQAMDELLKRDQFAIVLAAGNSRRLGLHTSRIVTKSKSALFRINVASDDHTDTFIEFWYPRSASSAMQFRARIPGGDWSDWIDVNECVELQPTAGSSDAVAVLVHRKTVPSGAYSRDAVQGKTMVLLALRPTGAPDDDDGPLAQAGQWEVEARVAPDRNLEPVPDSSPRKDKAVTDIAIPIDGWIKRDDSRPFGGRVQSVFLGLQPGDADDTLSNLANGERTVVAGGFRWSDDMPVGYSSTGRRRESQWPIVYGMCEWDSIDSGIRAAAVRSQETFLMNGTSVAAPVVARRIFNLMAATPKGGPPPDRIAMLNALSKDEMIRVDALPPEPAQAQISSSNEEVSNLDADLRTEPDPVGAK